MTAAGALGVRVYRWALCLQGASPWRRVIGVLVVYSLLLVALGLSHEAWRDEADAWLAAQSE